MSTHPSQHAIRLRISPPPLLTTLTGCCLAMSGNDLVSPRDRSLITVPLWSPFIASRTAFSPEGALGDGVTREELIRDDHAPGLLRGWLWRPRLCRSPSVFLRTRRREPIERRDYRD